MNGKIIAFFAIVIAIVAAIFLLPSGQQEIVPPAPSQQMSSGGGTMGDGSSGGGHMHDAAPAPPIDSLHVAVQDSNGTAVGHLTLVPDESAPLEGTGYSLRLTDFYTHLVMQDGQPVNLSPHPDNVAARIEILKSGEVVDYTWTFEKVPFFRMGDMGGQGRMMDTGLAFALETVFGLPEPHANDTNP